MKNKNIRLVSILPFMETEELKELALKIINEEVTGVRLVTLYPFLSGDDLDEIIDLCIEKGKSKEITHSIPFLRRETITKIHNGIQDGTITGINQYSILPFLGKSDLKSMFDNLVKAAATDPDVASDVDDDDFDLEDE